MPLFVGIDGGGTKTDCVVGDDASVLGRATAEACKVQKVGEEAARVALQTAIRRACAMSAADIGQVRSTCIGIAGAGRPDIVETVRTLVAGIVPGVVEVVGDMGIAMEAAFGDGPGMIVVAGTGSIAYGRNDRGETARAGGWGPLISDEGSGEWIGKQAVAAAMRAHDAGQNTVLAQSIVNTWHVATRDDMSRIANSYPPPDFAALFPLVLAAAERGDTHARELLTNAGRELGMLGRTVIRRLWPGPQVVRVAVSGGVFQNSSVVRNVFANTVLAERPQAAVSFGRVEAALGALSLARRAIGARGGAIPR